MNILIAEPLAAAGIELFKSQPGWNTIVSNPKEYSRHLADADALLVRSAVQVDQSVLEKAPKLRVIGRAGVGVDNVDLDAATAAGVLVMNTPGGNAISVAEHTLALMLAMARHIPQANASTSAGKWEKKKFMGSELRGKTLGVVGLGSIGREVVRRARAFEMRILAYDPYVTANIAHDAGAELATLQKLYAESDYITLHVAATPETQGMLSPAAFSQMKNGVRILNCARGELVDEAAARGYPKRQGSGRGARRVPSGAAPRRLASVRPGQCFPDAAHRRVHGRGPGDRRRPHRRTSGGVFEERPRDQRREHAVDVARAVSRAQPLRYAGRPAGKFRGPHSLRQSAYGPAALLRQDRRQQYQPAAQRRSGGHAEPFHFRQGQPDQCPADCRTTRMERGGGAR